MIYVSCLGSYGRLGNQMFQYAAAYSLARMHNAQVAIRSKDIYYSNSKSQLVETFELNSAVMDDLLGIKHQFQEKDFQFNDISNLPDQTDIIGYFQSEQYFVKFRDEILEKEFKFRKDVLRKANVTFRNLKHELQVCSLHVRRGDYINLSVTHPPLTLEYYEKAIALLPKEIEIFVFSDNVQEAKTLLESSKFLNERKKKYITEDYATEICLMSMCDYHVIANSSFSWWGAWLSNSKKIIAPKLWFGQSGPKNWKDVYCKEWEIV